MPDNDRGRPGERAASNVINLDETSIALMPVTGVVIVDIREAREDVMYRRFFSLGNAPTGCKVSVMVGALIVDPRSLGLIVKERRRLSFEFCGEPLSVRRWVRAAQTGDPLGEEVFLDG